MSEKSENRTDNMVSVLVKTLVSIIEEKDGFMKGHAERVASTCVHFSVKIGLPKTEIEHIYLAGLLHDIGMVFIPLEIIQKQEKLTEDEMCMVKNHPVVAEKILSNLSFLKGSLPIIRHHHEAVDGSGYPDGLKGEEIPLGAKILCLVKSYDAMTTVRSDSPALTTEEALVEIKKKAGQQFEKDLINDFIIFLKAPETSSEEAKEQESKEREKEEKEKKVEEKEKRIDAEVIEHIEKKGDKEVLQDAIQGIVKRFKRGEIDLPVLPKVVQEIQKVMSKPSATVDDLAKVIERDAVISVKVISAANSPFYRGTEKVRTVETAIPRLGFKETQSIVSAIANKGLYDTKKKMFKTLMQHLWLHSLSSAYSARALAKELLLGDGEKFFLMGLIHDIGKVLLIKALDEISLQMSSLDKNDIITITQDVHTNFGGAILRRWGFTEDFVRVALLHNGKDFNNALDKDVLVTNLANNISYKIGYSLFDNNNGVDLARLQSAILLELTPNTIETICEDIKNLMEGTNQIF